MAPPKPTVSFDSVTPMLLSSSCDVLANNSAIPDSGQLSYPFRKGVWIDEVRWDLRMNATFGFGVNLGALVSTKLMLGQLYLMRDPVPVWLLGTTMSFTQETESYVQTSGSVSLSHYRWRLPSPLFVEPGQVLSSWFTRGNDGFGAITVQTTYVGRTAVPGQATPKLISVPYAAPFVTTLGNTYQQSNEKHLFNPFDRQMHVQRLTGRVLLVDGANVNARRITTYSPVNQNGVGVVPTTILMNDSWGGKMVNNNTGPSDVFDVLRGAWTVDSEMPAKGVYEVRIWNIQPTYSIHVGMIGSREERI